MKNIERIVVMGGSFNPPTIAHQELMKDAMKAVDAQQFDGSVLFSLSVWQVKYYLLILSCQLGFTVSGWVG